jgi:hypothetical protein
MHYASNLYDNMVICLQCDFEMIIILTLYDYLYD